ATAVPRQLLAIGGSTAALAAAVVVGLIAGPTPPLGSQIAPESSAVAPTRRPARPPTVTTPPPVTTTPSIAGPPASGLTPYAGRARLTAQGPGAPVELEAGGDPVSVRITVRNVGDGISQPVALTLTLPAGISATGSGFTQAGTPLRWSFGDLFAVSQPGGVTCAGGTGSIRCATAIGLAPGSVVSFLIGLRADADATGGTVTGRVTGGGADVSVALISVLVRPALDSLDLRARAVGSGWRAQLQVRVTNTGPTSGPVTATITLPAGVYAIHPAPNCAGESGTVTCTGQLGPRQQANWELDLRAEYQVNAEITVAAKLGRANRTRAVQLELGPQCTSRPVPAQHCPPGKGPHGTDPPGKGPSGNGPPGRDPHGIGLSAHPVRVQ
ncbi:MAG TPA: hypothetical protein VFM37_17415, partial [Pseudonocardiaceae bacterium]|nr:hypothetical protein [Pseudonocardiaceae bacterium]